jgi:hypothetical protein
MTELKPYTAWLDECRRTGISPGTPPPPEYQSYDEWYRNTRGINLETGKRDLRSYGDWIAERAERGLPANAPAPEGYESQTEWFKRVRGLDPETGKPLTNPHLPDTTSVKAPQPTPPTSSSSPTGASGFMRRALTGVETVAGRLGQLGSVLRGGLPVFAAFSTLLHAIVEAKEFEKQQKEQEKHPQNPGQLHADIAPARSGPSKRPGGPTIS